MTYESTERAMTVWAISMVAMIVIGLPTAIIWGMHASHAQRHAVEQVEKPTAYYNLVEYEPAIEDFEEIEYRHHHYGDWADLWYSGNGQDQSLRHMKGGFYYYNSSLHTYRIAQSITGILLGAGDINYLIIKNWDGNGNLTLTGATQVCKHGEYTHISPNCCYK